MPVFMVAAMFLVPRYFTRADEKPRPVALAGERLLPFRAEILSRGNALLVPQSTVGYYIYPTAQHVHPRDQLTTTLPRDSKSNKIFEFADFLGQARPGEAFGSLLSRHRITHVFLDEWCLNMLSGGLPGEASDFVAGRDSPGWELVASGDAPGDRWRFYRRAK